MSDKVFAKYKPLFGDFQFKSRTPRGGWDWVSYDDLPNFKPSYPYNIVEKEDGIQIQVAAIGLDKEDIKIDVEDNLLTVSYEKQDDREVVYQCKNITNKGFNLTWSLSHTLDLNTIEASLDKGMLFIDLKIKDEAKPKKITIK